MAVKDSLQRNERNNGGRTASWIAQWPLDDRVAYAGATEKLKAKILLKVFVVQSKSYRTLNTLHWCV